MTQRWRFVSDGDGHNFLIPAEVVENFYKMLEEGEEDWYCEFSNKFREYSCGSPSNYTFENPEED